MLSSLTLCQPFLCRVLHFLVYVTSCVVIQLVQKALKTRKFKGPVAGPVGMYLKIVNGKEKYAKIAEYAIGQGNLDRFIVTNQSDMQLMNKLRKDAGCGYRDCPLYQISPRSTDEKYNTPAPPNGVETVTSVVSVENAMVFNFLVDSCKIDESALADSKDDSENKLLNKDSSGKCSIRGKVKKVYCLPNGDFWQVNKGFLNITSNERPLKQTIGVDRSAAIDSAKHEMKAIQKELERNKREEATIEAELKKAKKEWNLRNKERATLSNNISNMEQLLEELKEEADASGEVPSIDTTEFENDITAAEDELSVLHLGGYFNESLQSKFSRNRVKEDIELIHHSERCLQTFTDSEQQRKSGETPFTSTQCLHIFGLGAFISVVLRTEEIQRKRG